jgi:metal-responsive CopG/Arc/MetJ family transcriptional regulator
MSNNTVSDEQQLRYVTIALRPELMERLEAARLQAGMRSRSALVAMLLEEVLLGDEPTEAAA